MTKSTRIAMLSVPAILMLGLMAGFFYAFSVSVMPGLDRLSPARAIETMQAINAAVRNPVFFVTFFLTPVIVLVCAAMAWTSNARQMAWFLGASALVYGLGVIVPTSLANVPMNRELAIIDPMDADNAMLWADYASQWTVWNNGRMMMNLLALGLAAIAPLRA